MQSTISMQLQKSVVVEMIVDSERPVCSQACSRYFVHESFSSQGFHIAQDHRNVKQKIVP